MLDGDPTAAQDEGSLVTELCGKMRSQGLRPKTFLYTRKINRPIPNASINASVISKMLIFWSIAVGIVLAAGMIPLAVIGSVMIGVILLVFVNKKSYYQEPRC